MKLYLVRHGQTDWNVEERAQGRTDIPLNATGVAQAEALRDKVRDYGFDICYSSPLIRAFRTAQIVTDGCCEIIKDELLTERCFGAFEGTQPRDEWLMYWDLNHPRDIEGMEPLEDVCARTKKFLDRILADHSADAKVLVVGHGGMLKALHFNIVGYDENTDFLSKHIKNGEIWEYEL